MEKNGWTPARLFQELGGASGETITKEKLEDKAGPCHAWSRGMAGSGVINEGLGKPRLFGSRMTVIQS